MGYGLFVSIVVVGDRIIKQKYAFIIAGMLLIWISAHLLNKRELITTTATIMLAIRSKFIVSPSLTVGISFNIVTLCTCYYSDKKVKIFTFVHFAMTKMFRHCKRTDVKNVFIGGRDQAKIVWLIRGKFVLVVILPTLTINIYIFIDT